jgi:hypothetical protein
MIIIIYSVYLELLYGGRENHSLFHFAHYEL